MVLIHELGIQVGSTAHLLKPIWSRLLPLPFSYKFLIGNCPSGSQGLFSTQYMPQYNKRAVAGTQAAPSSHHPKAGTLYKPEDTHKQPLLTVQPGVGPYSETSLWTHATYCFTFCNLLSGILTLSFLSSWPEAYPTSPFLEDHYNIKFCLFRQENLFLVMAPTSESVLRTLSFSSAQ